MFLKIVKFIFWPLRFLTAVTYDQGRYLFYSSAINKKKFLSKKITKYYHGIEKGLTLTPNRKLFGMRSIHILQKLVDSYVRKFGFDEVCSHAISCLSKYMQDNSFAANSKLVNIIELGQWLKKYKKNKIGDFGGYILTSKEKILKNSIIPDNFFNSRYSIRVFKKETLNKEILEHAIEKTEKTPCVCNRQNTHFHIYFSESQIKNILKYQNGNKGFSEYIKNLVIITYDIGGLDGMHERNQGYIDGGMRGMSFIYGLHSIGIGSCCLNWCSSPFNDMKLRKIAQIPLGETIIMLIAVGNLIDSDFRVTSSPKLNIKNVIKYH